MLADHFDAFAGFLRTGDTVCLRECFSVNADTELARVYHNGFLKTCVNALASNYPTIVSLVGAEFFRTLALGFVREFPPARSTLVAYGNEFPLYLGSTLDHHGLIYLEDIARMDQAWLTSFFAIDQQALTVADVHRWTDGGGDINDLPASCCAHTVLVATTCKVAGVWREIRETRKLNARASVTVEAQTVLLWRAQEGINARLLTPAEAAFLQALSAHPNLGKAAEQALRIDGQFNLPDFFASLLLHQIICQTGNKP